MSDTTFTPAFAHAVHPLDDAIEQKLFRPELGRMPRTRGVRAALMVLRLYVASMVMLAAWQAYACH